MTLNIQDDSISSNYTSQTARLLPGQGAQWEVSWLPGQPMDRNHAVTAMGLADATRADAQTGQRLSMNIINYAAKLVAAEPEAETTSPAQLPSPSTEPSRNQLYTRSPSTPRSAKPVQGDWRTCAETTAQPQDPG